MVRGWFVGNLEPTLSSTDAVEVGVKHYRIGDTEESHHHKGATEVTVILAGSIGMGSEHLSPRDIVLEPNDESDLEALTDASLLAVNVPSVRGDNKYVRGGN